MMISNALELINVEKCDLAIDSSRLYEERSRSVDFMIDWGCKKAEIIGN